MRLPVAVLPRAFATTSSLLVASLLAACGSVPDARDEPDAAPDGPPPGPAMVTFTSQLLDGSPSATGLVAFQDGEGPWQVVNGKDGVYTFAVTGKRYGLFTACERANGSAFVHVQFATVDDGLARFITDQCVAKPPAAVAVSGNVSNAVAQDQFQVSTGRSASFATMSGAWSSSAISGTGTLLAMSMTAQRPNLMHLNRVNYTEGGFFPIDFNNRFLPADVTLNLDPTATAVSMSTYYIDEQGGQHSIDLASTRVATYRVVPLDRVGGGVSRLFFAGPSGDANRVIERAFKTPVAQTLTLPLALVLSTPPTLVASAPYPIIEAKLPTRSGASHYQVGYFSLVGRAVVRSWALSASASWVGQTGTEVVLRIPDLSQLPGWQATYELGAGARWTASVSSGPARLAPGQAGLLANGRSSANLADGEESTSSSLSGDL